MHPGTLHPFTHLSPSTHYLSIQAPYLQTHPLSTRKLTRSLSNSLNHSPSVMTYTYNKPKKLYCLGFLLRSGGPHDTLHMLGLGSTYLYTCLVLYRYFLAEQSTTKKTVSLRLHSMHWLGACISSRRLKKRK